MPTTVNILLVDDDIDDHEFFKDAIKEASLPDYRVNSLYNGKELVDYLLNEAAKEERTLWPDLIVLDLNMPIMDGLSALRMIREREYLRGIPIFVLSTSKNESSWKACQDLGCTGYYIKGVSIPQLREMIQDMLYRCTEHF